MSKLRSDATIENLNHRGWGYLPGLLGVEMLDIGQGTAKSRMALHTHHFAPNGFIHAASIIALADTTCGYATYAHLPDEAEAFTTIELKANYLGTVRQGSIACRASALHLGGTTQVWDATVTDEATGRTIAVFRCTQMVLRPKEGKK